MFKQIVVGTDGSAGANIAVDAAIELARLSGATLHVVSARKIPSVQQSERWVDDTRMGTIFPTTTAVPRIGSLAFAVGLGPLPSLPRLPHFVQLRLNLRDPLELDLQLLHQAGEDLAALV